jgi:hypothetical protein
MTINGENPINLDGCVDHHFYPEFKGKPIREVALMLAQLEADRPPKKAFDPVYRDHMDQEFYLIQEISGRCGDGAYYNQYLSQARSILKLLS